MNVACAVPDCANPVVAQCQGYGDRSCGRFFCQEHSDEGLCPVCALEREKDLILRDYVQTAENVHKQAERKKRINRAFAFLGTVGYWFLLLSLVDNAEITAQPAIFLTQACFVIGIALPVLLGVVAWRRGLSSEKGLIRGMNASMPDFAEFYRAWKSEKRKRDLDLVLALAIGAVGATIAAAASSIAQDQRSNREMAELDSRIQHEVKREFKRRGIE
jgi:hypothetical protein